MATTFANHLLTGNHASRPAASAVPEGTLYACTTHGLVYQSDGVSAWTTWHDTATGTPGAHATSHQNGGSDEISVAGLSGLLADAQTPATHASSHQNGGGDEISVTGLSGELADAQPVTIRKNSGADVGTRSRINLIEGTNVTLTVVDDAGGDEVDVTIAATGGGGSGVIVQVVNTQTGAVATGSTVIPHDDTIPQNTEGDEYMTLAITPTDAGNKLKIEVIAFISCSGSSAVVALALFQDSTADALAAIATTLPTATGGQPIQLTHYMTAGTTSATTFKVRIGPNATTITFNGQSGSRRFGGVCASSITITEIVP